MFVAVTRSHLKKSCCTSVCIPLSRTVWYFVCCCWGKYLWSRRARRSRRQQGQPQQSVGSKASTQRILVCSKDTRVTHVCSSRPPMLHLHRTYVYVYSSFSRDDAAKLLRGWGYLLGSRRQCVSVLQYTGWVLSFVADYNSTGWLAISQAEGFATLHKNADVRPSLL